MNASNRLVFVCAAVTAVIAGCASPSPAPVLLALPPTVTALPPVTTTAVTTNATTAATAPGAAASAPLLAIRRVNIPEYLIARRVRYRADASTLAEWPNTFWAERIEIGVSREFVSALRAQLPGWSICEASCGDATPELTLHLDIVPMDYLRSTQTLRARARVTLNSADVSQRVIASREFGYELNSGADTAQAQAQVLTEMLRQVAAATAPMVAGAGR